MARATAAHLHCKRLVGWIAASIEMERAQQSHAVGRRAIFPVKTRQLGGTALLQPLCQATFARPSFDEERLMGSSKAQKLIIEIAILIAAIGFFPGAVGYAWALGWLPVYGAVCHFDKIFGPATDPDGYRIYLIGRGCSVDAAIRSMLAASQFAAGQDKVDADRIIDIYHHKKLAVAGNETLAVDFVQQKSREFAASTPSADNCSPGKEFCSVATASDEEFFLTWAHAYLFYVKSQFRFTAMDGSDYIASLLRMGLIAQVIATFCYLAVTLFVLGRIFRYVMGRLAVTGQIAKNKGG
jgi:hypothetical protein